MEILNNIWNVLTTENEMLTNIIIIPFGFVENYLTFILFSLLFKLNYTKKQSVEYVMLSSICISLTNLFIPSPFNIFINYIVIFLLIYIIFNLSIIKALLALIIPQLTFTLIGTLLMGILINILNSSFESLSVIPLYRLLYLSLSYILFYLLLHLLYFKKIFITFFEDLDDKNRIIFIANLLLGIFTIIFEIILLYFYVNIFSLVISIISVILLLSYFCISIYSLTRMIQLQTTTRDLETAENYNETLQVLYDNVKAFKHDFDNMIHMLDGYVKNDDFNGLKKYYNDLTKDYNRVNNISVLDPHIINNPGIYNMLVSKYKLASKSGVKLHIEFFMDFNNLHMPIYEFSRILGILLDNAIEAASECNTKKVNIMFRASYRDNVEIINIENTYKNKDINIDNIFDKETSTKNKHMGMGLWEVKQIINRFNHIKIVTNKNEDYFSQQLEIYY